MTTTATPLAHTRFTLPGKRIETYSKATLAVLAASVLENTEFSKNLMEHVRALLASSDHGDQMLALNAVYRYEDRLDHSSASKEAKSLADELDALRDQTQAELRANNLVARSLRCTHQGASGLKAKRATIARAQAILALRSATTEAETLAELFDVTRRQADPALHAAMTSLVRSLRAPHYGAEGLQILESTIARGEAMMRLLLAAIELVQRQRSHFGSVVWPVAANLIPTLPGCYSSELLRLKEAFEDGYKTPDELALISTAVRGVCSKSHEDAELRPALLLEVIAMIAKLQEALPTMLGKQPRTVARLIGRLQDADNLTSDQLREQLTAGDTNLQAAATPRVVQIPRVRERVMKVAPMAKPPKNPSGKKKNPSGKKNKQNV